MALLDVQHHHTSRIAEEMPKGYIAANAMEDSSDEAAPPLASEVAEPVHRYQLWNQVVETGQKAGQASHTQRNASLHILRAD